MSTLVTRAQQRCDMEYQDNISDSEWKGMLSTSYAELYSIVAESGLRYFETTQTYTTDGTADYAEPDDHMATVGLDYVDTQGDRRALYEIMAQERNRFSSVTGGQYAVAYAFIDDELRLYPTPPSGQTYELVYVPQPPDLSSLADAYQVDVVTPDGEAFLLWATAVQALAKEESDTSLARAEREAARERVYNWAVLRALNSPRRKIVDSDPNLDYDIDPASWWYSR